MDGLRIILSVLLGVVSCKCDSRSVMEVVINSGDNITLYCDCKQSTGVFIVWYRNCSHENQPSLFMEVKWNSAGTLKLFTRFQFLKNQSSDSYDLLIANVTDSDQGLYYCGTKKLTVEDDKVINSKYQYKYGNVTTRVIVNSSETRHFVNPQNCGLCWMLLFCTCPAVAVLFSLLSSLLVYRFCQKTDKEPQVNEKRHDPKDQRRLNLDEDICYAALEIRQVSQRPKMRRTDTTTPHTTSYTTYSKINVCSLYEKFKG